jgi:hypothetical protein
MEHCSYSLKYSLIRMPLRGQLTIIDKLLDAGILMPEERRELLMNHGLLAATVEFFLMHPLMAHDARGCAYLPLRRGERAYDLDQFLECLERTPEHLARLTSLIRAALFSRFVQDAAAAA